MTSTPLISIIMPCFYSHPYVMDAINSVINQTYTNWELILSPDDNLDYLIYIDSKVSQDFKKIKQVFSNKIKTGPGAARNRAIDIAQGQFITMLDSDDMFQPNYLESLLKIAEKDGIAIAPLNYYNWKMQLIRQLPSSDNVDIKFYARCLGSMHSLHAKEFEHGYMDGFAEDVMHDAGLIGFFGNIKVANTRYLARLHDHSITNSESELIIQRSYQHYVNMVVSNSDELRLPLLSFESQQAISELFSFRAFASAEFEKSNEGLPYNSWVNGKETTLWNQFNEQLSG